MPAICYILKLCHLIYSSQEFYNIEIACLTPCISKKKVACTEVDTVQMAGPGSLSPKPTLFSQHHGALWDGTSAYVCLLDWAVLLLRVRILPDSSSPVWNDFPPSSYLAFSINTFFSSQLKCHLIRVTFTGHPI